jgi:hypothetical protein
MEREALKLALEAFRIVRFCVPPAQRPTLEQAATKCEEALAQPAQDWKTLPKKDAPLVEWAKGLTTPAAQPTHETDMLTIAYYSGYHDGKKAALAGREWNFCERCGKRTKDLTTIHTCTPPQEGE